MDHRTLDCNCRGFHSYLRRTRYWLESVWVSAVIEGRCCVRLIFPLVVWLFCLYVYMFLLLLFLLVFGFFFRFMFDASF